MNIDDLVEPSQESIHSTYLETLLHRLEGKRFKLMAEKEVLIAEETKIRERLISVRAEMNGIEYALEEGEKIRKEGLLFSCSLIS